MPQITCVKHRRILVTCVLVVHTPRLRLFIHAHNAGTATILRRQFLLTDPVGAVEGGRYDT
jgi:hypothetical protein